MRKSGSGNVAPAVVYYSVWVKDSSHFFRLGNSQWLTDLCSYVIGGVGGVCPHMSRAGVAAAAEGVQQHPAGNEKSSGTGGLTVSGTVIPAETLMVGSKLKYCLGLCDLHLNSICQCLLCQKKGVGGSVSCPQSCLWRNFPSGTPGLYSSLRQHTTHIDWERELPVFFSLQIWLWKIHTLFYFFSWSRVDWHCVSFRCIVQWFSYVLVCSVTSVVSDSLWPPWTLARQAPLFMEFSRQEYWRVFFQYSLLQEIFLTQGLNPGLLHCRRILYHWTTREALDVLIAISL